MKYRMTVSYDGTRYKGWQRLKQTRETIQDKIESVLSRYFDEAIVIDGAGRTDAGVHARAQVCSFSAPETEVVVLQQYMNRYLPEDIAVTAVTQADSRFHARFNAVSKTYAYMLWTAPYPPIFERQYVLQVAEPIDLARMEACAAYLIGRHDFKGFCTDKTKKSTVRTIHKIVFERQEHIITCRFTGDGFLYNMVRILMGTLLEVGKGKREPESVLEVLEHLDRRYAGETAPAQGLILEVVDYEGD
ncbi:tRNA pseudouridine(38-40) synthase TruA [Fusibacter paucivorans]|uniref:tRNA pseudouridine synthase A n=1 Tax=Fusibacter paucivorans TaxID=76009 RepID=A0ABS5PTC2_9FIRM|nr:tRNA pseudouridine(38-40) synthase TruA [Fusibacter paucivorans]